MATSRWVPERRDIVWIDFTPHVGAEMRDRHPMLVLSPRAFNERTSIVIGLPMTHAVQHETNPFAVRRVGAKGEVGYIIGNQPKSFDWRARDARPHPWRHAPDSVFGHACETLNQIISLCD
jgi:mRNA interferase MazF